MQLEVMEAVMNEMLEELKRSDKSSAEQANLTGQLIKMMKSFEQKLDNLRVLPAPVDTAPLQKIVKEGLAENKSAVTSVVSDGIRELGEMVKSHPPVVTTDQVSLFAEQIYSGFKSTLILVVIVATAIIIVLLFLFLFLRPGR